MELEATFVAIQNRLNALGRSYRPADEQSVAKLQRWWEDLALVERTYDAQINKARGSPASSPRPAASVPPALVNRHVSILPRSDGLRVPPRRSVPQALLNMKKMGGLIKIFDAKATKLDTWLSAKAVWLQASVSACNKVLGKPAVSAADILPSRGAAAEPEAPATPMSPFSPRLSQSGGEAGLEKKKSLLDQVVDVLSPAISATASVTSTVVEQTGALTKTTSSIIAKGYSTTLDVVDPGHVIHADEAASAPPGPERKLSIGISAQSTLTLEDRMTAMTVAAEV